MRTTLNKAFVAAQAYRNAAQAALTERLAARPIDAEQRAAHGFARVATTVAALAAGLGCLETGADSKPPDAKVPHTASVRGRGHNRGGLPLAHNETFKPAG